MCLIYIKQISSITNSREHLFTFYKTLTFTSTFIFFIQQNNQIITCKELINIPIIFLFKGCLLSQCVNLKSVGDLNELGSASLYFPSVRCQGFLVPALLYAWFNGKTYITQKIQKCLRKYRMAPFNTEVYSSNGHSAKMSLIAFK